MSKVDPIETANTPIKDIFWTDKLPHCYNKYLKKTIKFKSLHFQGSTKYIMSKYLSSNN